jgi:Xaa-Pro dipeptidase
VFDTSERIGRLRASLGAAGIDAALLGYSRSLLYYTGTTQPSLLVVTPDRYRLLVSSGFDRALEESSIPRDAIAPGNGYGAASELLDSWGVREGQLGLELDILPAKAYLQISRLFPGFRIADAAKLVLDQRKRKSPEEVELIRQACQILHQGHLRILEVLREGMTELELSAEVEDAQRRAGHEGLYFIRQPDFFMGRGPLASGENLARIAGKVRSISGGGLTPSIPMGATRRAIERGDLVVVDIPTHWHGYHSDQSRTYAVGPPRGDGAAIYAKLRDVADRVVEAMKPGVSCGELYRLAFSAAGDAGIGDRFMRLGRDPEPVPFIGHGIGLELNEPPLLARESEEPLEEGTVVTLEIETGGSPCEVTKLEDMLLVTPHGAQFLSITPRDLHEV